MVSCPGSIVASALAYPSRFWTCGGLLGAPYECNFTMMVVGLAPPVLRWIFRGPGGGRKFRVRVESRSEDGEKKVLELDW